MKEIAYLLPLKLEGVSGPNTSGNTPSSFRTALFSFLGTGFLAILPSA